MHSLGIPLNLSLWFSVKRVISDIEKDVVTIV